MINGRSLFFLFILKLYLATVNADPCIYNTCCSGGNQRCEVQGSKSNRSDSTSCFCDHLCVDMNDCCSDYKSLCRVCFAWTILKKKISAGAVQHPANTIPSCIDVCLSSASCVGFDFDEGTSPPCWIHDNQSFIERRIDAENATQYVLSPSCSISVDTITTVSTTTAPSTTTCRNSFLTLFTCKNGKCINYSYKCDGYNDCGDNSDEECSSSCSVQNCQTCYAPNVCEICNLGYVFNFNTNPPSCQIMSTFTTTLSTSKVAAIISVTTTTNYNKTNCSNYEFRCKNSKCISLRFICDRRNDCGDMSDEENCTSCWSNQFKCKNSNCVLLNYVCDRDNDCGDFSDEENCSSCLVPNCHKCQRPYVCEICNLGYALNFDFLPSCLATIALSTQTLTTTIPICNGWTSIINTVSMGGFKQPVYNLSSCMRVCVATVSCVAIDYDKSTSPPCSLYNDTSSIAVKYNSKLGSQFIIDPCIRRTGANLYSTCRTTFVQKFDSFVSVGSTPFHATNTPEECEQSCRSMPACVSYQIDTQVNSTTFCSLQFNADATRVLSGGKVEKYKENVC